MCTPELLAGRYLEVLTNRLGFPAQIDHDHTVTFQTAGATWLLQNHAPTDPEYLHLQLFCGIPENTPNDLVDQLALKTTTDTKVVKAYRRDQTLVLSAEMLVAAPDQLPQPDHLAAILPRTIHLILAGVEKILDGIALHEILNTPTTSDETSN